jgi:hypothetical protein
MIMALNKMITEHLKISQHLYLGLISLIAFLHIYFEKQLNCVWLSHTLFYPTMDLFLPLRRTSSNFFSTGLDFLEEVE